MSSFKHAPTHNEVLAAKEAEAERIRRAHQISRQHDEERRESSKLYAREARSGFVDDLRIESWMARAACKSVGQLFFKPAHVERKAERLEREERAKAVCGNCAVRQDCLDTALANKEREGIWGGLTESERAELPKQQEAN